VHSIFFADITPPQITPNSDRCYKKHGDCWCKIFLRLDALPVTEQTVKKNWRDKSSIELLTVAILGQKALLMPPIIHVHDNSGHSALMLTTVLFLTWLLLLKAFRSQASMDNTDTRSFTCNAVLYTDDRHSVNFLVTATFSSASNGGRTATMRGNNSGSTLLQKTWKYTIYTCYQQTWLTTTC